MTGWSNGLSQDYNKQLGTWFADRLGARNQLRRDMETKNEALELAHYLEICDANEGVEMQAAAMLRFQASEIAELECHYADQVLRAIEAETERDQLKVKLEQLTSGDVELPDFGIRGPGGTGDYFNGYTKDQLIDYGNRRAAQAAAQKSGDSHEIWAAAQLVPGEGIADGVARVEGLLDAPRVPMTKDQANTILSAHYEMDPASSDMDDEDWIEVLGVVAAIEAHHGIGVKP